MTRYILVLLFFRIALVSHAQTISQSLAKAYDEFSKDEQLRHATSSLYVIDAISGKTIFDKNSLVGLAPASTQKIITSVTALEMLGADFQYQTKLGYVGKIIEDSLDGYLYIQGSGDPSFGSWRFGSSKPEVIINDFINAVRKLGIKRLPSTVYIDNNTYDPVSIPDGWIWQDIGNYYGAAPHSLNWRENQFDILLRSSEKLGSRVEVISVNGNKNYDLQFQNELVSAEAGTGDNAYLYLPIGSHGYILKGTIPINEKNFKISGAAADPSNEFLNELSTGLKRQLSLERTKNFNPDEKQQLNPSIIYTHHSVALDSLIYWFNKKSINLYGEALLRTLAKENSGYARTDSGITVIKGFWKSRNISPDELNISDGSGLSPLNRVTTHAQVEVLKFASSRKWFQVFYNALPDYNGMRMKSGTISDVKGFCGYHTAADGKKYIFSFLVNNYSGASSSLVNKMYKVLDKLK